AGRVTEAATERIVLVLQQVARDLSEVLTSPGGGPTV
ncbi:IclR family transcriptional regulator, partial [Streptomyces sp. CHB19.2]|nr:IclR family transcriptional regulator [Streptomyces sp. CHB19.2]